MKFRDITWIALPVLATVLMIFFCDFCPKNEPSPADEIDEVSAVIDDFQTAYSNKQQNDLRNLFYAEAVIAYDFEEGQTQRIFKLEDWLQGTQEVTFNMNEHISDQLTNRDISVFRNIAYAVCDYTYTDDNEIGRGVDVLTLMKMRNRWRIVSLVFTGDQVTQE
jgi:ketosteroid isomerase-like protein